MRGTTVDLDVPAIDELPASAAREAVDRRFAMVDLMAAARGGTGIPVD